MAICQQTTGHETNAPFNVSSNDKCALNYFWTDHVRVLNSQHNLRLCCSLRLRKPFLTHSELKANFTCILWTLILMFVGKRLGSQRF
jgi:hypothetical protein